MSTQKIIKVSRDDYLRNRANAKDRPTDTRECRERTSTQCAERGHDFVFRPFDRYGCCKTCGCEILT